jgi:hypothetical protein
MLNDGGTASATRRLAFWTFSAVLDYAMHDGAMPANPAKPRSTDGLSV